ncbi:hypothetical protein BC829DRAFT_409455 [Chytridium lagenaria]|nr:hypothetical protein BC829DRAFT_409455 [Chytridium lagenaria]
MSTWQNLAVQTLSAVRTHGLKRTFKQIVTLDQPRVGVLVGTDVNGNEYYENRADIWNYDPTQVPPEWHQWLHKVTDDIPSETTFPTPLFTPTHVEHLTGTTAAFKTYNTTKPKIESWEAQVRARAA